MKKMQRYILFGIILMSIFLRVYNFPMRYGLGEETVRDAVIGLEGARQLQAPLTGAFSSLGPFTFGPWYAYQLIVFSIIVPYSYAPWIYLTIISILYVFIIYKVGEILIGKYFGLILSFIAAVSPAQVISATHLTSHNNTNIFAILSLWIFLKLIKQNLSNWWAYFLGVTIGIGMNLHYQMSGLLIFPLLLLITKRKKYSYFILSFLGVFTTFIPLLIFELNNHWFNTKNMIYYMMYGKNLMYVPNRWLFYLRDFWPAFWADALGTPVVISTIIIVSFLVVFATLAIKKKISYPFILIMIVFLANFIALRYYWGHRFFGYLNYLRPFVFIFTGFTIFQLTKFRYGKFIIVLSLLALSYFTFNRNASQISPDPYSTYMYGQVNNLIAQFPDKKFEVYSCSKKYVPQHNASVFTTVFILDMNKKLDSSSEKIAIPSKNCEDSYYDGLKKDQNSVKIKKVNNTEFLYISGIPDKTISELGWQRNDFNSIYEANARWWFKERP